MGSGKKVTIGYMYYMDVLFCLCTGPCDAVRRLFYGEELVKDLDLTTTGQINVVSEWEFNGGEKKEGGLAGSVVLYKGEADQIFADKYKMSEEDQAKCPEYRGVVTLMFRDGAGAGSFYWSAMSPYFKNPWFEVQRITSGWTGGLWQPALAKVTASDSIDDMNPIHIIYECITNMDWGMGVNTSYIDDASFVTAATICKNEGIGLSMLWTQQQSISEFIDAVLNCICGVRYVDSITGKIVIKLLRDDYDVSTLPEFNPGNIIELRSFQRTTYGEIPNEITIIYTNRMQEEETIVVQDLALIQTEQSIISLTISFPGVRTADLASRLATREIIMKSIPLTKVSLRATRAALKYNIGDRFKLVWPELGVINLVCRILKKELGGLNDSFIDFEATEEVFTTPQTGINSGYDYVGGFNSGKGKGNVTSPDEFVFTSTSKVVDKQMTQNLPIYFMYYNIGQQETLDNLALDANYTITQFFLKQYLMSVSDVALWYLNGSTYMSADMNLDFSTNALLGRSIYEYERKFEYIDVPITELELRAHIVWTDADVVDNILRQRAAIDSTYYTLRDNVFVFIDGEIFLLLGLKKTNDAMRIRRGCLGTVPKPHNVNNDVWFCWYADAEIDAIAKTNGQSVRYTYVANDSSHSDTVALANATTRPNDHTLQYSIVATTSNPYSIRRPFFLNYMSQSTYYSNIFNVTASIGHGAPSQLIMAYRWGNRLIESMPTTYSGFWNDVAYAAEDDSNLRVYPCKPYGKSLERTDNTTDTRYATETIPLTGTQINYQYTGNYLAQDQGLEFQVGIYINPRLSTNLFNFTVLFEHEILVATPLIADLQPSGDLDGKLVDVINGSIYIQGVQDGDDVTFGTTGSTTLTYYDVIGYQPDELTSVTYKGIFADAAGNYEFYFNSYTTNGYDIMGCLRSNNVPLLAWKGGNSTSTGNNRRYFRYNTKGEYMDAINLGYPVKMYAQKDTMRFEIDGTAAKVFGVYATNAFDPTVAASYEYLPRAATPVFSKVGIGVSRKWKINRMQIFASRRAGIEIDDAHTLPDYSTVNKYEMGDYSIGGTTQFHHYCNFNGVGGSFGLNNELILEPDGTQTCTYDINLGYLNTYCDNAWFGNEFTLDFWIKPAAAGQFLWLGENTVGRIRAVLNDDDTVSAFIGGNSPVEYNTGYSFNLDTWNHFRIWCKNWGTINVAINGKVYTTKTLDRESYNVYAIVRFGSNTFTGTLCGIHYSYNRGYIKNDTSNFVAPKCPLAPNTDLIIAKVASDTQSSSKTHTITIPTTAQVGDTLLLIAVCRGARFSGATLTPTFTTLSSSYNSATAYNMMMNVYSKAYATTDTTITVTLPGNAEYLSAILYVVRGDVVDATAYSYNTSGVTFTKTYADSELLAAVDQNDGYYGSTTLIIKAVDSPADFTNIDKIATYTSNKYWQQLAVDNYIDHPAGNITFIPHYEGGNLAQNFTVIEIKKV